MSNIETKLGIDPFTIIGFGIKAGQTVWGIVESQRRQSVEANQATNYGSLSELATRIADSRESLMSSSQDDTTNKTNTTTYIAIGAAALISIIALSH